MTGQGVERTPRTAYPSSLGPPAGSSTLMPPSSQGAERRSERRATSPVSGFPTAAAQPLETDFPAHQHWLREHRQLQGTALREVAAPTRLTGGAAPTRQLLNAATDDQADLPAPGFPQGEPPAVLRRRETGRPT